MEDISPDSEYQSGFQTTGPLKNQSPTVLFLWPGTLQGSTNSLGGKIDTGKRTTFYRISSRLWQRHGGGGDLLRSCRSRCQFWQLQYTKRPNRPGSASCKGHNPPAVHDHASRSPADPHLSGQHDRLAASMSRSGDLYSGDT